MRSTGGLASNTGQVVKGQSVATAAHSSYRLFTGCSFPDGFSMAVLLSPSASSPLSFLKVCHQTDPRRSGLKGPDPTATAWLTPALAEQVKLDLRRVLRRKEENFLPGRAQDRDGARVLYSLCNDPSHVGV